MVTRFEYRVGTTLTAVVLVLASRHSVGPLKGWHSDDRGPREGGWVWDREAGVLDPNPKRTFDLPGREESQAMLSAIDWNAVRDQLEQLSAIIGIRKRPKNRRVSAKAGCCQQKFVVAAPLVDSPAARCASQPESGHKSDRIMTLTNY
jgi:hypothetical protein